MAMFFMDTLAASMRLPPFSERRPVRVSRLRRGTSVSSFMKRLQMPGRHARMPLKDTVRSFAAIVDGEADDLPEWAFFNVGTLEDARQKAAQTLSEEKGGAV